MGYELNAFFLILRQRAVQAHISHNRGSEKPIWNYSLGTWSHCNRVDCYWSSRPHVRCSGTYLQMDSSVPILVDTLFSITTKLRRQVRIFVSHLSTNAGWAVDLRTLVLLRLAIADIKGGSLDVVSRNVQQGHIIYIHIAFTEFNPLRISGHKAQRIQS